jgi:hypothetical protein
MKKLFFLSLILMAAISANTQTAVIKGKITEHSTKEPVPFAHVILEKNNKFIAGTTSDFDGNYQFTINEYGSFVLNCSYVGYKPWKKDNILIEPDKTITIDIDMEVTSLLIQGVEIVEYRAPLISMDVTASHTVVTSSNMSKVSGVSSNNSSSYKSPPPQNNSINHGVAENTVNPGLLTASELNDFSKWELWKDIESNDLKRYQEVWNMYPEDRYSVIVKNANGHAVINAVVKLIDNEDQTIWSALTDNTGKAELWGNFFGKDSKEKNMQIVATVAGKDYVYDKPHLFPKGINQLVVPVECEVPDQIEIAFVVDATGSMNDEIKFLKSDVINIIEDARNDLNGISINLGSVFYRCLGNSYVTVSTPLSTDIKQTINFINRQNSGEGGDEAVEEAMQTAIDSLKWSSDSRARLLFLILDEQPLTKPDIIKKMQLYTQKAAEKGIRIIPVVASAETMSNASSMEYLIRSMALATNGTYVFLTDHSQIGDAHAKPVTDKYDVELLNTLIKRIIWQFSFVADCDPALAQNESIDTTSFSNSPIIAQEIVDLSRISSQNQSWVYTHNFSFDVQSATLNPTASIDSLNKQMGENSMQKKDDKTIEIKIFPNPTASVVHIKIEGKLKELMLTDISGKLLENINTSGDSETQIDLGKYPSGIYFLKFSDNGKWYSGKVVLVH